MDKVPKCISNSAATYVCMNESCNQPNPFVCGINHECQQHHRICLKLQWTIFKEILDQNRHTVNPIFKILCDKVDKMITKGIEQLKGELVNFNNWTKQYGVAKKIEKFYECIQLNMELTWTGKDICKLKNDKQIKFDNFKIGNGSVESVLLEIQTKRSKLMEMIRGLYVRQKSQISKISNKIIKIKQKYLGDLNKKLEQMKQEPEHLELKFVENQLLSVLMS